MIKVTDEEQKIISTILKAYLKEEKVLAYGSRVKGNCHPHSDLDLAIKGKERMDLAVLFELKSEFESSDLPFRVDLSDYHRLDPTFQKIIDDSGVEI